MADARFSMSNSDKLHRFTFQNSDVRGEIISLDSSYQAVISGREYSPVVASLMGQFLAATGLLSATMKFDGVLSLQAKGDGHLRLLMTDCTRQHLLRGIARTAPVAEASNHTGAGYRATHPETPDCPDFLSLIGNGHLAITIEPARGERYQGLVPLDRSSVASCLERYFDMSEQLPTRLWLVADGKRACGLLLQALPPKLQTLDQRQQHWQHITCLADTLSNEELQSLDSLTLLSRLFHQDPVRLLEPRQMDFGCSCSQQRTGEVLRSLGRAEVLSILAEEGLVEIKCQFCDQLYRYSEHDITRLFAGEQRTVH